METAVGAGGGGGGGISPVNDDILYNIFGRLPARSFASAACVCKAWKSVCNRILCRPKFASAVSLNPSLDVAVKEVLHKVLSEPVRPHFAIACVGVDFSLEAVHHLITKALGSRTPVITNTARGIIGIDALTNEVKEVKWESMADHEPQTEEYNSIFNQNRGIVLAVGFLPGFKVEEISLFRPTEVSVQGAMVDKFIMDINDFTASVSESTSPSCIIMFGGQHVDMKPIIAKLDSAMDEETVIVGDACGSFLSQSTKANNETRRFSLDAVALVLARDKNKPQGLKTIYSIVEMNMIFGNRYRRNNVPFHIIKWNNPFRARVESGFNECKRVEIHMLSALVEGDGEILHGQSILKALKEEIEYDDLETDLFIGVIQEREQSIGSQHLGSSTCLAMYKVLGGDKEYFVVDGVGIKAGDSFLFYHSDSETAASSSYIALQNLAGLKPLPATVPLRNQVFGGLIFSCHCRGQAYFGRPNVNTTPFSVNFPGVPLAGMFCVGEIGRAFSRSIRMDEDEYGDDCVRRCLHVYSTVYLVMSHVGVEKE